jgi:hypothetical protein
VRRRAAHGSDDIAKRERPKAPFYIGVTRSPAA